MKTKFLLKLLLLSLFCVALTSCTGDEILSYTQGASSTTSATSMTSKDGATANITTSTDLETEPIITKPK
jgi:hypothetical protein